MLKTAINPACLQQMLESASNAAQKGQAQYFTPPDWGAALGRALPNYRPCLVDFTCGHGHLLAGAAGDSTRSLLGCDIDPSTNPEIHQSQPSLAARRVTADITRFYPLLHALNWRFDLAVLNPPFDLHQYRDRVADLAQSDCPAVRRAFAAHDGRTTNETIDSTALIIMLALDRMTEYGEAFVIANQATLDRLILAPDAPHGDLRDHIWAHVIIPGNICDPQRDAGLKDHSELPAPHSEFNTGVLYFARDHFTGLREEDTVVVSPEMTAEQVGERLALPAFRLARGGGRIRNGNARLDCAQLWSAAKEEWNALHPEASPGGPTAKWNIWLHVDGTLMTNLSTFDTVSGRVDKAAADRLFQLNGQRPIHLVMAVAQRRELERAVMGARYRVAPAVVEAVKAAIEEYGRARASLYPLNKIQCLGYVDEHDTLECLIDLGRDFKAGQRYRLRTETIRVIREGTKMNNEGGLDDCEYDGAELAIFLDGARGEKLFMEARHVADNVRLSIQDEGEPSPIHYTLNQLVDHFDIPHVPDVAALNPADYDANLAMLREIEELVA